MNPPASSDHKVAVVHTPLWNLEPFQTRSLHLQATEKDVEGDKAPESMAPEKQHSKQDTLIKLLENKGDNWRAKLLEYLAVTEGEKDYLLLSLGDREQRGNHSIQSQARPGTSKQPGASLRQSREQLQELESWLWKSFDGNFWGI